jgi:hypothetical protein
MLRVTFVPRVDDNAVAIACVSAGHLGNELRQATDVAQDGEHPIRGCGYVLSVLVFHRERDPTHRPPARLQRRDQRSSRYR